MRRISFEQYCELFFDIEKSKDIIDELREQYKYNGPRKYYEKIARTPLTGVEDIDSMIKLAIKRKELLLPAKSKFSLPDCETRYDFISGNIFDWYFDKLEERVAAISTHAARELFTLTLTEKKFADALFRMSEYETLEELETDDWISGSITDEEFFDNFESGPADFKTIVNYLVEDHLKEEDYVAYREDFISFFM